MYSGCSIYLKRCRKSSRRCKVRLTDLNFLLDEKIRSVHCTHMDGTNLDNSKNCRKIPSNNILLFGGNHIPTYFYL